MTVYLLVQLKYVMSLQNPLSNFFMSEIEKRIRQNIAKVKINTNSL